VSNQPPRHVNINIVACPHTRSYEEIQQDLVKLLEAAARREPKMWGVIPAYQPIEDRYPTQVSV
jgi:hypothetical protein